MMADEDQDKRRGRADEETDLAQLCAEVGPAMKRIAQRDIVDLEELARCLDQHARIPLGVPIRPYSSAVSKETLAAVSALLRIVVTAKVAALEQEQEQQP